MQILNNEPLGKYTTMRLGGSANFLVNVENKIELQNMVKWGKSHDLPILTLGGGSNIVFKDDGFNGLVIINKISGFETVGNEEEHTLIKAGGGEIWDDIVKKTVEMGLSGIEAMTLVPGSAGAAPVQNIGCYGQELSQVLVELSAYDLQNGTFVTLKNEECDFQYRSSRFNRQDKGRFIVTDITLRLSKLHMTPPFYKDVEVYFENNHITEYTPFKIREALIKIRGDKLPDPKVVANSGSFFRNPIISNEQKDEIIKKYPELGDWQSERFKEKSQAFWDLPDGTVKVAAGMLLEHSELRGIRDTDTGMATWPKQALILVNESAKNSADLLQFRDMIIAKIKDRYGITLEQEPELV